MRGVVYTAVLAMLLLALASTGHGAYGLSGHDGYVAGDASFGVSVDANGTVYIVINMSEPYKYTLTQVSLGLYNSTHIYVSYLGLYATNITELNEIRVLLIDGEAGTLIDDINITHELLLEVNGNNSEYYRYIKYVDVSNKVMINYTIYNITAGNNQLLHKGYLLRPSIIKNTTQLINKEPYLAYIANLVPLAILIAIAGRGDIREFATGLIIYGIIVLLLPFLGLYANYTSTLSALSIVMGIIILILS